MTDGATTLFQRAQALAAQPRSRRLGAWLAGLFVAFGLFGFLAGPPIARSLLLEALGKALHRPVTIQHIAVNPYALSATIEGLSVKGEDGEVAGFDRLYVNAEASSLFRGGPVVQALQLDGLRLKVTHLGNGRYDISDLLDEWLKPSDSPTPRFSLNNIELKGGRVEFIDSPSKANHVASDIVLRLPFLSTLPYQTDIAVTPHFSAKVNDSPIVLEGSTTPFAESHASELHLDLDHVNPTRYLTYLPVKLPFQFKGGTVDTELKLVFKEAHDRPATLTLAGAVHVNDLALADTAGQPLAGWKKLDVVLQEADLLNLHFNLERIALHDPEVVARVDSKGRLNWLDVAGRLASSPPAGGKASKAPAPAAVHLAVSEVEVSNAALRWQDDSRAKTSAGNLFRLTRGEAKGIRVDLAQRQAKVAEIDIKEPAVNVLRYADGKLALPSLPPAPAVAASSGPAWAVAVDKLAVAGGSLRYEDKSLSDPVVQTLDALSVKAEGLTTAVGGKAKLAVNGRINDKGSLKVGGTVQLSPLAVAADYDITGLPLIPLQPFFTDRLNVTLVRGQVSGAGSLSLAGGDKGMGGALKGSLTLGDFHLIDKVNSADLLKWKSLYFGNVDLRLQPLALNVGEVALSDFYSRLIVNKDGRLNLSQIVRQPEAQVASTTEPVPAPQALSAPAPEVAAAKPPARSVPPIRVGKVTLQGGTINFSDYFVKPNYTANLTRMGGRVTGLSSAADSLADLELRGTYDSAPVQVKAKLNPLAAKTYLDLQGEVRGVDLTSLSPYSGKYAGYAIEKGKLSLFVTYKLENSQLNAENRIFLDQLTFGEKVNSPDATSLPVTLAVALLKNGRGEIDINLPISGSLEDPQFSVGGVIVRVIVNLFVKAVTSPFALLGSLFGGGEELSMLEFDAGRTTFPPAAVKRLEALAKAMTDRPALKLEVAGRADPETDREGLRRVAMERAVRAEKLKDQVRKGVEGGSVDSVKVEAAEYPTFLARAYKEAKFPKPRNLIGMQKDLPVEEMEKLMLTNLPASDEDLRQLAIQRAESVQAWLLDQGKVPQERVFLMPPKVAGEEKSAASDAKPKSGSRVDFSLR